MSDKTLCKSCDGAGSVPTGIEESPEASCRRCDGDGYEPATPPAMNAASPTAYQCRKKGGEWLPLYVTSDAEAENWRDGSGNCEWRKAAAPVGQGSAVLESQRWSKEADMIESWSGSATSGEAATIERAAACQEDFEAWSKREGALNLKPAGDAYCEDFRFPATYYYSNTETAWRAWANGRAALAAKAEQSNTPVPREVYEFVLMLTLESGGMISGNRLSARAKEILALLDAPVAERAAANKPCDHVWPEADGQTNIEGRCTKCGMSFQHYIHSEMP